MGGVGRFAELGTLDKDKYMTVVTLGENLFKMVHRE